MGNILKVKDSNGNWIDIPAIVGPKGEKGESSGVQMLDIYPVGAVYISTVETSPATLFGGVWEQIEDRFLLAAGNKYEAGSTGGASTHTLTVQEMPEHSHDIRYGPIVGPGTAIYRGESEGDGGQPIDTMSWVIESTGGNLPHNNMPPYLTVYMWKRTA